VRFILAVLAALWAAQATAQIRFDNTDDLLHTSAAQAFGSLNFTNDISVAFWLIKEVTLDSADEYLGKGRTVNGNVTHWSIRNNSGKFDFYFAKPDATFRIFTSTSAYAQTNVPIHVGFAFHWGVNASAQFYINGSRVAGSWVTSDGATAALTNAEPFRIGNLFAGVAMAGQIQEVAIWNGVLTDPEMKSLASRRGRLPLKIQPAQLRLYLPMSGHFPAWTTASGSNAIVSLDGYRTPITPLNSPQQRPSFFSR
jgi:hypothetical protein